MSIHNPSALKKSNNSEKKLTVKSIEVIELEAILADLQDSPLKVATPVKYSPCRARSSPRTNSAQKRNSPCFKRNLEKHYSSPGKEVKRIEFKSSPSKQLSSSSVEPSNGNGAMSPRRLSKANGVSTQLFNDTKKQTKCAENLNVIDIAQVLEESDNECVTPIKNNTTSNIKLSNGAHSVSSHKLSVTKRKSNPENKSITVQKSENLNLSDCRVVLENGIKTPTGIDNSYRTNSLSSPKIGINSCTKDFNLAKPKSRPSCNEKLRTNDIAAMLENSDDDDDDVDDLFTLDCAVHRANKCDNEVVSESVPSSSNGVQRELGSSSSRRKTNWKLEKYRMGYDDEDIIILKDYVSIPETSTKSSSKKKKTASSSSKPVSSSKQQKGTVDQKSKLEKIRESDDDIMIVEEPNSYNRNNVSSKKKGTSTSKKDSQAKKKEDKTPADSSRKSKVRRSLLQEATYSIEDCSQSPLRMKLKRKASSPIASSCSVSKDDSDEEPLVKLRKTGSSATKQKDKTTAKTSDTKTEDSGCKPLIKDRKTESLKRKAGATLTVEDEEDSSSDDEPLVKVRKMKTNSNSETQSKGKSLRSRESIKLPKWRIMDEINDITTLKSPTKSPSAKVKSNLILNFDSPNKPITPNKNGNSSKFDELVTAVQNKFGKGEGPVNRANPSTLEIEKEYKLDKEIHKTPSKNGLSKSVSSPRRSATKIERVPLELNECNSRPSRSKAKTKASNKLEHESPNILLKKVSNKENLLRSSSEQLVTKDLSRSPSKSNGTSQKSLKQNSNSPLKLNSDAREEIPSERIKKSKNTTDVIENSLDNARIQLMVSAVPKSLPCRDKEFNNIYSFLGRKIEDFAGGCMYISGVPGTGKTATVHAVIRKLQDDVENGDLSPFDFVEINSLRLTEPRQAYTRILQCLTGSKLPSEQALRMLENKFSGRGRKSTVLLVDELDYLCNRRQDVIYSILEWPMRQGSGVVVLTIANTMDLPERTLKGKVTSRMGLTRLTFQPYTHHQLQEIVMNRLIGNDSFHPDAVQLVARKVAAVSGDARRALDICRRATELVSPNKGESSKTVTIQHVEKAVSQISSGRRILAIKACSTMAQFALRALRDETLRTGIDESNVAHMYKHLLNVCALEGVEKPTFGEIQRICTNLESLGLIIAEKGKNRPDLMRKLSLNVSSDDIHYALNC